MTTPEDKGCAKRVAARFSSCSRPCERRGVVLEHGQMWCWQHAPSEVAAWTLQQVRAVKVAQAQAAVDKANSELLEDVIRTGKVNRVLWLQTVDARRALLRVKGKKT